MAENGTKNDSRTMETSGWPVIPPSQHTPSADPAHTLAGPTLSPLASCIHSKVDLGLSSLPRICIHIHILHISITPPHSPTFPLQTSNLHLDWRWRGSVIIPSQVSLESHSSLLYESR